MTVYVFGYGSLINQESAARTLHRLPTREELIPARLHGWQRKWQIDAEAFLDDQPARLVFLDIVPSGNGTPVNGILIPLNTDDELARLDQRERHYNRTDVTRIIDPGIDGIIYTYIGKPERTNPPPDALVMSEYERVVAEGLHFWGTDFENEYHRTTIPHEFNRHHGSYRWKPKG